MLLEPSFQTWSLAANLVVAPLVPPITVAATLALAVGPLCPPLGWAATATAGIPAEVLATAAQGFAALPGARLPWADGPAGVIAMALVSVASAALVWGLGHQPRSCVRELAEAPPRGKVDA
ncbi:ComEC/Rec2 family competence protein [Sinomonas susongensis]|uniref:ComEC/Rec2 family competence protein n=1 Tax=Sinomonas susongensis TaxID=1324851 RepID=UPI001108B5D3|nr:ComEC/Rec2 family competence protein [Sinomonas susongensis]